MLRRLSIGLMASAVAIAPMPLINRDLQQWEEDSLSFYLENLIPDVNS